MFTVEESWNSYVKFTLEHIDPERLDDLKRIYFSGAASLLNMMSRMEESGMDEEGMEAVLDGIEEEILSYEELCRTGACLRIENPSGVKH